MKKFPLLFIGLFLFLTASVYGAKIDSLDIPSAAMSKSYKAVVVLPKTYAKSKTYYPVMYLLHGGFGHHSDWTIKTPDKNLVPELADKYNMIIVMPEGEVFSYYIDSPVNKSSLFETYLTQEVISRIDNSYRTIRNAKGRAITGLSMGGYGALYLATRHPDLYGAAGSMSGVIDLRLDNWKFPPETANNVKKGFESILGPLESSPEVYDAHSVVDMYNKMKTNGVKLIFDCGVDDFLIEPNRELHRRLVYNKTPHDYAERPGGHNWDYWQNSLPHHALFFAKAFESLGATGQASH